MKTCRLTLSLLTAAALGACAEGGSEVVYVPVDADVTDVGAQPPTDAPTQPPTQPTTLPPTQPPTEAPPTCADLDRDGYQDKVCNANAAGTPKGGDCDDHNNLVNPARLENCQNQIDDNCNGQVNDGCAACLDADGDGHQPTSCNPDPTTGGDCDDEDPRVHPGAVEACNDAKDNDCVAGDLPCLANCTDDDRDGYGQGSGCLGADCDDTTPLRSPGTSEICGDGIDQDCANNPSLTPAANGDFPCPEDCEDADRDAFGNGPDCLAPDCNDNDASINPGAREIPGDTIDQDCNGSDLTLNDNCTDHDRDGYGRGAGCSGVDCDDGDPRVSAGRAEICGNAIDDDCDGSDRGCSPVGPVGNCVDADGDGFGPGCANGTTDCDDNNNAVNANAAETCNAVDDNCNGQVDECPQRGQRCVDDRCVSDAGSPCEGDEQCDPVLNLVCNEDLGECRVADGAACQDSNQCNPGAECTLLDVCNPQNACYQAKGGPCDDDCDCSGVYLCHSSAFVCIECLGDENCAMDEVCTPGGFCATDAYLDGPDHRVSLLQFIAWCWSLYTGTGEEHACGSLTLPDELSVGDEVRGEMGPAGDSEIADFVCDSGALSMAGFLDDDIDVIFEVFGCGLFDIENIWWRDMPLNAGTSGEYCVYYTPAMEGFGLPSDTREAIVIDDCNRSTVR